MMRGNSMGWVGGGIQVWQGEACNGCIAMDLQSFVFVVPVSCDVKGDATCCNSESSRGSCQSCGGDGETLEDNAAIRRLWNTCINYTHKWLTSAFCHIYSTIVSGTSPVHPLHTAPLMWLILEQWSRRMCHKPLCESLCCSRSLITQVIVACKRHEKPRSDCKQVHIHS